MRHDNNWHDVLLQTTARTYVHAARTRLTHCVTLVYNLADKTLQTQIKYIRLLPLTPPSVF